ncbi:MAG: hypothetical protein ACFFDT_13965 [Candidatus Hodarchaeota archaeon]
MYNLRCKKGFFFVSLFFISILMLASFNVSATSQESVKESENESAVESRGPATIGLVEAGGYFDGVYDRLTTIGFSVTNISLTELNIGNFSLYDVVYLPTAWALSASDYADIEAAYLDFQSYVSTGGGLVVEQPAPSSPATPTILPYPVTFDTNPAGYSSQVVFSGHPITEGLEDSDMPIALDEITSYDTDHYLELAENTGGEPTLLVLIYGTGKIAVHTDNTEPGLGSMTNVTLTRIINWAAGELVFSDVSSRILFDDAHDTDGDELSGSYQIMNETMYDKGFKVGEFESGTINPTLLADYGILIILDIEIALSPFEITTIHEFLNARKSLLYINEVAALCVEESLGHTLWIYGIEHDSLLSYTGTASNFTSHPITQGVSMIDYQWQGGTLKVSDPAVTIMMDDTTNNNPLMAVITDPGKAVAITDSDAWKDSLIGNHNNSLLLNNTLDWLKEDAPTVTVASPNGGESLSETETLSWTASDADGDSLTYSVYYSADNGGTWALLASGLTNTSIDWDTTTVPDGEEYLIKVVVSDGTLTAEDQSDDVFTIDNAGIDWTLYGAIAAAVFFALLAIIIYMKQK